MKKHILVIDDKIQLCRSLQMNFEELGYKYSYSLNSTDALKIIKQENISLILLDLSLGEENGLDVLCSIKNTASDIPVVIITGFGSIDSAVKAMKLGAVDYIQKPLKFESLFKIVELILNQNSSEAVSGREDIIISSAKISELMVKAKKLAATDFSVLIIGESGTGKEHLARFIHSESSRSHLELHTINCASFPENLLDNELFGHEKGAYTGADNEFKGIFERADKSTLFLDEIGDMSLATQAKILRTLQNNEIRRIGGNQNIHIDVRIIAATNKDLIHLIKNKDFRDDLYYRLNTAVLEVPPLRERKEDIFPLVDFFLIKMKQDMKKLSDETADLLLKYNWPGNIRELRNTIRYAAAISEDDVIGITDLPESIKVSEDFNNSEKFNIGGRQSLEDVEKDLILKTLHEVNDNKKLAAEKLKISRRTLYNKLEKYAIK